MKKYYNLLITALTIALLITSQITNAQTINFRHYNGDSTLVIQNYNNLDLKSALNQYCKSDTIPFAVKISYFTFSGEQYIYQI